MARLIPQKQIEEINEFRDSISVNNSVFISGSLLVSQSINIGSNPDTPQRITGSVEITGSLELDGQLSFKDAQSRLDATASFSDISVDTQKFGGISVKDFGGSDATIYVSATRGSDDNDGRSPQFPLKTIGKAAEIATPGNDGRFGLPTGSNFSGFRIDVDTGTYLEDNPIELPRNTTVWGSGLRVTKIIAKNENEDLFWVNSGCYLAEMTFGGLRVFPSVDVSAKGFAVAFAPNAFITTSPYVQNCSMISNQENSFLEAYEEIPPGGGGLNVDGNRIHPDSPLASMVLDAYTQVAPNGVGCQVVGRGFIQLVSFFTNFSAYSVKVIDGGQAVLLNSNTSFGDFGMYASGSRFITGSGGNQNAFINVQNNYSIIVDTIENGLSAIPPLVTNTENGYRATDPNIIPQYFTSADSSAEVAEIAKSDFRLVTSVIENGDTNEVALVAKSSTTGYSSASVYNISGDSQITSSLTASSGDITTIDTNYTILLDIIDRGNVATSSYTQVENTNASIFVGNVDQYSSGISATSTTQEIIGDRFDEVIDIITNGPKFADTLITNTSASFKFSNQTRYQTDIVSSDELVQSVSESISIVYNILDNGTGSNIVPDIIQSSSVANPTIEYQNAYELLINNIPFIQDETIEYLSSSWSEFEYNQETCKRDVGFIVSGAAHDLLYGGNEESVRNGIFYYEYPSDATTTQKDPTLTAIKYVRGLTENVLKNRTFRDTNSDIDNGYDVLFNNKDFIREETISYLSSSWSTFDYNEAKCRRDLGYIIDAVGTDLLYDGNERTLEAGNFYYKYPSLATVDNGTTGQKQQTIDGIKYAKRLSQKLVNDDTFVTSSVSIQSAVDLARKNRSLIQNETITYINTKYPTFSYNESKCRRDTGYIIDNVITDLLYGGNERSELAGLYYYLYPSIANTTQLEETLEGIRYSQGFLRQIVLSNNISTPQIVLNTDGNIRVTSYTPTTSSVSGGETEIQIVSQSFGIIEDIIRYGDTNVLGAIAANSSDIDWTTTNPINTSGRNQITSSTSFDNVYTESISSNYETVIKIIESGSSIVTEETVGTDSKGSPISTVGIPKDSYGDNLVKTVIGVDIPNDITIVKNTDGNIKFNNNSQYTASVTASSTEINKVSSSFASISDIIEFGITGSSLISGSSTASTYFEVVTLDSNYNAFYFNKNQLSSFDDIDGENLPEDSGSYDDGIKDPTLTLKRGELYTFSVNSLNIVDGGSINPDERQPFYIKTQRKSGTEFQYTSGITNNGTTFGTLTFIVPFDAPDRLFYVNGNNVSSSGIINIVDTLPLSDTQRYIDVPSKGEIEVVYNTIDNIKVTNNSQFSSSLSASVNDTHNVSSSFATVIDILENGLDNLPTVVGNITGSIKKSNISQYTSSTDATDGIRNIVTSSFDTIINILENGVGSFTPTTATYDPSNGNFVMTIPNHGLSVGTDIHLNSESFVFTCDMDGNKTEHKLPSVGQPAYNNKLEILSTTTNTITVNVGKSGPNIEWTPSNATYDPATGNFVITTGTHTLSVGEGIVLDTGSFAFTCEMDNDQSTKSYPRFGIDPYAGRSMIITDVTDTTMTVNVGASGPNKYFTPSDVNYNALSGDMVVTVGQHGLGVNRSVVLENESFAFTCDQDGDSTTHSYPRSGSDPYAEQSILITSVGTTSHTVTNAPYNASTGDVTITITNHGFSNGDYIKLDDNSLTYTCVLDGDTVEKSYPRPGYDYPSGRWLELSNVTTDTFDINIGSSSYTNTHTFISATSDGLKRQDGTFTINVGDGGSASGSIHTFVSASNNAIKHEPQTVHTFVSASNGAVKHLPQSVHTFVRTDENSVNILPILDDNISDLIKVTSTNQVTSSISATNTEVELVSSSYATIIDVLKNGTSVLPTEILNTSASIKVTDTNIYQNVSMSVSNTEIEKVSSSFAIVLDIVENGTGSIPTIVENVNENIKVGNVGQYISSSYSGSLEDVDFVSSSFAIVTSIITNGLNSAPTLVDYTTRLTTENAIASYEIIKENIDFIQEETITYLSSSWSTASYDEEKCRRDVGFIVSGAAEDLIYNANSASVVNGRFYFENPSLAETSQINQTLDGINYASRLAQKLIQNIEFVTASQERLDTQTLLTENTEFIQNETISYLSSSWSTFDYVEITCKRDVGHIIDAVKTDVVYGGNERSVNAGEFYYLYPSSATGSQLQQTLDGIDYARRLADKVIQQTTFVTASNEVSTSHQLLRDNKQFIQDETIEYISASWSEFDYVESTCKRDVGYIIDAVATDVLYGGNERTIEAADYYFRYPSDATGSQLSQTVDAINYARRLSENIVVNTQFAYAPFSRTNAYDLIFQNRNLIQTEVVEYISSSWADFEYDDVKCARDVGYILDAVTTDLLYGGNERSRVAGEFYYLYPSDATGSQLSQTVDGVKWAKSMSDNILQNKLFVTSSEQKLSVASLITENKQLIQDETISYLSSSWSTFDYNESKCKRDVGYILDAVVTDFVYGGNERAVNAGEFYYLYPSDATGSQLSQTSDGISFASRLVNKLITNTTLVTASLERQATYDLLFENKSFIQDEVISYISSSWSGFEYIESKCRRDTGYIIDAVATDTLYGGNERSVTAGEFYYLFPSEATGSQLQQTVDGVRHAAGVAEKLIQNTIFTTTSLDKKQSYDLILNNKDIIQDNVIDFIDQTYPYFTYNRVKCRRDTGYIIDAVITDLLYGGNQRSVVAGIYYYLYPSEATTVQLEETIQAIRYADSVSKKLVQSELLTIPSIIKNSENNIRFTDTTQYTDSIAISGSSVSEISSSFESVIGIITDGVKSFTPEDATYNPANGDFVMTIPNHTLTKLNGLYLRPDSFVFTCDMDGNRTEHILPSVGQPAYNNRLPIKSTTTNTITVNVGKSGPNIEFNPTNATYDPSNGEFVVTVGTHSLSVGEGVVMSPESFAFTCDMDNDQSTKSYPREGIDPFAVRSIPITSVTDTTLTFNVGASGPNKYFTPTDANYNASTGDMIVTVGQHGLGVGRSVVLEDESFAFTCDQDNDATTHSYPRPGSDPYAGKSIVITSVGTTSHSVTNAPYDSATGDVTITIASHGFSNGDYIKLDDNSLTYTCVLDGNTTTKSYPRPNYDYPSGRWLEISNVTTNTFDINIGSSPYVGSHTFVSATTNGLERQTGTFTINVGDGGSASGSIHTFVSASNNAVKHEPQSVHTFVSASNGALKHLPQSNHTFKRVVNNSVSTLPFEVKNIDSKTKVNNIDQFTLSTSGTSTEVGIISSSVDLINDVIRFGTDKIPFTIAKHFQTSELDNPQNLTTSSYVTASGTYNVTDELEIVSSSVKIINDIIENGTGSLPIQISNTSNNIKVGNVEQFIGIYSGSLTEIDLVKERGSIIENVVQNGTGSLPSLVKTNSDINNLIKYTNTSQTIGSSGDRVQEKIISSSFGLIVDILNNGTSSLPNLVEYTETIDAPKSVNAYNLLKNNISFIQDETIAFLSSSWGEFDYNETKCRRDLGFIISGAAEDLIWNANSASLVNGVYYYEYPSQATGSQLQQTLDGIIYAGNMAQNIVRGRTYVTASQNVSASFELLSNNRDFIKEETIAFVSSSWSDFYYSESKCRRDTGHIVDAIATDLLYGGNQRSIIAAEYYYKYPSAAIVGGIPSENQQKDPTVTAINYIKGLVGEIVSGSTFVTSSNEVEYTYDSIRENREFIQNETVSFINAKYPNLVYNEQSCSRDTGFIVDAIATDLRWGGNQRSITAGEFYYRFPSKAISYQLDSTVDGIVYIKDLIEKIANKETLEIPQRTLNTNSNIKFFTHNQFTGSLSGSLENIAFVSSSIDLVTTIIANGTGSYETASLYGVRSTDPSTLAAYEIIKENIDFIKDETIAYLSSSWSTSSYNEEKCKRDVGFIISGAAEDLVYNSYSASIVNGKFYYEFPSEANGTGSQINQTLDGIFYASRITQNLIQNTEFVTASLEVSSSYNLIRENRELIQSESISYLSSSWSSFDYNEEKCKRDITHIIDAVSTDVLYGGNERSINAGNFYYKYPSSATNAQVDPTTTGIEYAGDLMENLVQNNIFVTASSERIAGNKTLLENREFIQNEVIAYISSSWSNFDYNEASCSRDTGYILDAVATDFLYGGNERSRTGGEYYYLYPSEATTTQVNQTTDGIKYASGISQKLVQNIEFVTASNEVSASWNLLRDNKEFIQNEVIAFVSSSWSGVYYDEDKCKRDVGHLIDATATDLFYGGNERSVTAGSYYWRYPSRATNSGVPSEENQLDPTIDGVRYAKGLSQKVIQNVEFTTPSNATLVGAELLIGNKNLIQTEVITFLSSSWSEFEYNQSKCFRDVGYIIDAVRTDMVYGGNERSLQAGRFYYYIPSVAITEQKPQTIDGIDFAKGLSENVILKNQLTRPPFNTRVSVDLLKSSKKILQGKAISYTNGAFPNFVYNEEKCYRDTGFILDAIATDLFYGGNERSIEAAKSYYNGVYGDASAVVNEQKYETADANRFLRTQFQRIVRNSPLENFGSLIITTGHDFSYSGAGVTYKALPPNQGGAGIPDPDKEITEIGGGRVFFTSGNELGDFRIGAGLVINQATGTLQGRTFSRSLFSLVTPFSLALQD